MLVYDADTVVRHPMPFLYGILADVGRYASYMPECKSSTITQEDANGVDVCLIFGKGPFFHSSLQCRITYEQDTIYIVGNSSAFSEFLMKFRLTPVEGPKACAIYFHFECTIKKSLRSSLAKTLAEKISQGMIESLRQRADHLAWRPALASERPSFDRQRKF